MDTVTNGIDTGEKIRTGKSVKEEGKEEEKWRKGGEG